MAVKFKHGTRRRAIEYEKDWVQRWKDSKTFEKSVENRSEENGYVFYDGPPFITGDPHHGTLLSSIVKDAVPRYWTMKGRRVERVWGWDCHGLPAENFVEKQLNITDRRQIIASEDDKAPLDKDGNELPTIRLEEYVNKARESMTANSATWENVIDRAGRWVDFKGAYKTMDKEFMESVWWAFKQLYDAGKIYEGEKVLMYDTKFATPVSKAEVTMDNDAYQTVTDPSVYVKFKVKGENFNLLAWTTTPWTLPANTALAVGEGVEYAEVEVDGERLILAKDLLEQVLVDDKKQPLDYKVVRDMKGNELVGLEYEPLFADHGGNAHKVWSADYVSIESGTGIVHLAPIYGEEDFELAKENDIPRVHVLDDDGFYHPEVSEELFRLMPWVDSTKPLEVWDNNKNIAKGMHKAGLVWKIDYIEHEYPFNPRSKQRIMYRAIPSWFFDIQGSKPLMLEQNENINWFPKHLKHGRFENNIKQAPDWNLSRDRFWATAMPVWKGDRGTVKVVGSYAELKELSGVELDDYHRPWIDEVTFEIDGEKFERVDKVLDGWFESGSMPFAQFHYPFANKEKFEVNFPGDFIVEYIGQVRAWFYYVHAVNTSLASIGAFGEVAQKREAKNAFKNVITTGTLAGNDGRKMSKSLGNYTDPNELMDKYSADSLRFLLLSSPVLSGEDFSLQDKDVGDVARKLSMIWNMYDFFTMYAEVDSFSFPYEGSKDSAFIVNDLPSASAASGALGANGQSRSAGNAEPSSTDTEGNSRQGKSRFEIEVDIEKLTNPLDKWIVSRLHQLNQHVTEHMDEYDLPLTLSEFMPFIDDASNWYVRRSRRRFWKSEDDGDKAEAYRTLHYVLLKLSALLAPFTPFLSEELYHNLGGQAESVHLLDWPADYSVDQAVLDEMSELRDYINHALSVRAKEGIKVRQPLASVTVPSLGEVVDFTEILREELNVKSVKQGDELALDLNITDELKREGLMREVVRYVQSARKKAGLNVDDRISLLLESSDEQLSQAISEHASTIEAETLAALGQQVSEDSYTEAVKVDNQTLVISLHKA